MAVVSSVTRGKFALVKSIVDHLDLLQHTHTIALLRVCDTKALEQFLNERVHASFALSQYYNVVKWYNASESRPSWLCLGQHRPFIEPKNGTLFNHFHTHLFYCENRNGRVLCGAWVEGESEPDDVHDPPYVEVEALAYEAIFFARLNGGLTCGK